MFQGLRYPLTWFNGFCGGRGTRGVVVGKNKDPWHRIRAIVEKNKDSWHRNDVIIKF